jgi:hypothetical protein
VDTGVCGCFPNILCTLHAAIQFKLVLNVFSYRKKATKNCFRCKFMYTYSEFLFKRSPNPGVSMTVSLSVTSCSTSSDSLIS